MSLRLIVSAVLALIASTAQADALPVNSPAPAISYTRDVQPIFTEKCVACHACYDSACQLNLGSAEGAARGASKTPVTTASAARLRRPRGCSMTRSANQPGSRRASIRYSTPKAARPP